MLDHSWIESMQDELNQFKRLDVWELVELPAGRNVIKSKDSEFKLIAYSDADLAGCHDDYKSTSGGIQFLRGKLVSWSSKKKDCTVMSTAKAEYVSLSACGA
ncbi:hypothetical protein Tco_1436208 [Tanacetum coccineum]